MHVFDEIRAWSSARELSDPDRIKAQFVKLGEEMGELAAGICRNDNEKTYDSIGDCVVVLTILAQQHGWDIENTIIHAYGEIKNRTGKTVDGVFVKDGEDGNRN